MFKLGKMEWRRTVVAGAGAIALSTILVGAAAAPVQSAESCLLVPAAQVTGEQLVCSHV